MKFRNREDAAGLLADALERYRGRHPLVLGVPRGGVPMAAVIAQRLGGDLDVMLVHKLRAPFQPELAIGSIDEAGHVYLARFAADLQIDESAIETEKRAQLTALKQRRERYTAARAPLKLAGRTVIVVDDGLATGSTMVAAVRSARAQRAARIVVAVGVAPRTTLSLLRREADDIVCLHAPADFGAVGEFFADFSEVTDEAVIALLTATEAGAAGAKASEITEAQPRPGPIGSGR